MEIEKLIDHLTKNLDLTKDEQSGVRIALNYKGSQEEKRWTDNDVKQAFIAGANWERNMPNEKDLRTYLESIKK